MRKICVYVGSRANYASIKSAMRAIQSHPELKLQLMVGASAVEEKYGNVEKLINADGFQSDFRFVSLVEGDSPYHMAVSSGQGHLRSADGLRDLNPDFLLVVGDRFDVIPVAMSALMMNIPIAHTMGGEVSGTVDESIRHALTKISHVHFAANDDAKKRIIKMGESAETVFNVGCPRMDIVREELENDSITFLRQFFKTRDDMAAFDFAKPFFVVSQHPITTEYGSNGGYVESILKSLQPFALPTILLLPNSDAGGSEIRDVVERFKKEHRPEWMHIFENLPMPAYIHLMNATRALIGNSSSGLREGAFIGTPVVNIGARQNARLYGSNVIQCEPVVREISSAIDQLCAQGKLKPNYLYGDGFTGNKIAEVLSSIQVKVQKVIQY